MAFMRCTDSKAKQVYEMNSKIMSTKCRDI
jgi:hypothetical protein